MRPALDPAEAGPGQPITTVEASDLQVVVADARSLFTTAFSQIGDDVPLTGAAQEVRADGVTVQLSLSFGE